MGKLSAALIGDEPFFGGQTYTPSLDSKRLSRQLQSVLEILADQQWHTLEELASRVGGSEAGVSARIRDLRKARFGHHRIEKERVIGGLWRYRLTA